MSHLMFEHPEDQPLITLTKEQSLKLLENTRHGRMAFVNTIEETGEDRIEIFPINYAVDAEHNRIVFRSAPGTKVSASQDGIDVAFETDGILSDQGWSVVLRGRAKVITDEADIEHVQLLGVTPWVPTIKDYWAAISIDEISGRHFIFGRQPERDDDNQFRYDPNAPSSPTPPRDPDTSRMTRDLPEA